MNIEKTTKAEAEEVDSAHFASRNSGPWKYDCLLAADRRTDSTRDGLAPIAYRPIAMTSPMCDVEELVKDGVDWKNEEVAGFYFPNFPLPVWFSILG